MSVEHAILFQIDLVFSLLQVASYTLLKCLLCLECLLSNAFHYENLKSKYNCNCMEIRSECYP